MDQTTATPTYSIAQCECPSCSASTVQASVITAIVTVLLATVVFAVVMIAVCKFHPKLRYGGAGLWEGQVYAEVGGDEGGVSVVGGVGLSGPNYMEVGDDRGEAFQLKENEAYGTRR